MLRRAADAAKLDFAVLSAVTDGLEPMLAAARQWREANGSRTLIATQLASVDEIELALAAGATLACGSFNPSAAAPPQRALQGDVQRIIQLLNSVRSEEKPLADLTQDLRADVALCYRLLRHVNSPAVGLSRPSNRSTRPCCCSGDPSSTAGFRCFCCLR